MNVVINDEWSMIPIYGRMIDGNLNFADLFAQHNEHRIFFPRMVMLLVERLTSFNTVAEMYLSWALITATVAIIFYMFWRANGGTTDFKTLAYFLPISLLMFSFRQEEAILWGFACSIYFAILGVVAALFLLDRAISNERFFPFSILCGILASYSFLTGLIVWPAGVIQIVLAIGDRAKRARRFVMWSLSGLIVTALYLHNYHFPGQAATSHNPFRIAEYFLAVLGAPFTFEPAYLAASIGAVLALIALLVIYQAREAKMLRANAVWISLIFFVAMSALAATLGRSDLGVSQALSSRYTPITILGIIGLYSFAISASRYYKGMGRSFCVHALLTLVLLGLIVSAGAGWQIGQQTRVERQMAIQVLQNYPTEPDAVIVKYLNPNPTLVREWTRYLKVNRLNVFAGGNRTEMSLLPPANLLSPMEGIMVYKLMRILAQVRSILHSLPLFTFHL